MREPPADVRKHELLSLVRDAWLPEVDGLQHLPVGFGAWHWRATAAGRPRMFVTLDRLSERHTAANLDAAYRSAGALAAAGLDWVLAPVPALDGAITVALGDDRVSVTPWVEGTSGDGDLRGRAAAEQTSALLTALHRESPPPALPRWCPLVDADVAERLAARTALAWDTGPYGEQARRAIAARLSDVERWAARYLSLARGTDPTTWVTTHGEPHTRNQLGTADGRTLVVDWESVMLGPAERDLRYLVDQGYGDLAGADPGLVELFDLEWRLDEVTQYAAWFGAPHRDTESDRVAIAGLHHELERPG